MAQTLNKRDVKRRQTRYRMPNELADEQARFYPIPALRLLA
jgi:hypothetical protein